MNAAALDPTRRELFNRLRRSYPEERPDVISDLIGRVCAYTDKITIPLPDAAKTTLETLCCLKSLDEGYAWAYEQAITTLLLSHMKGHGDDK